MWSDGTPNWEDSGLQEKSCQPLIAIADNPRIAAMFTTLEPCPGTHTEQGKGNLCFPLSLQAGSGDAIIVVAKAEDISASIFRRSQLMPQLQAWHDLAHQELSTAGKRRPLTWGN